MGIKHSGKISIGKVYAKKKNILCLDSDDTIEKKYFDEYGNGLDCRQIYKKHGKTKFKKFETNAIEFILDNIKIDSVVSLGGV